MTVSTPEVAPVATVPKAYVLPEGVTLSEPGLRMAQPESVAGKEVAPERSNALSPMPVIPEDGVIFHEPVSYLPTVVELPSPNGGEY